MAKNQASSAARYRCEACGWTSVKWVGRCPTCQAWGSVDEVGHAATPRTAASRPPVPAQPIAAVDVTEASARPTGIDEFDRVLGRGLVPGAVVLVAGEPGVGKSTLLLEVAGRAARAGTRVLYVSGEESAGQITLRAQRIGAVADGLLVASETDLAAVLGHIEAEAPGLLIVDSVQTMASSQVDGLPGGVSQVRETASAIIAEAKRRDLPAILVGHVTKDGSVAGPRLLEHLVDVVCQFEGERHSQLRLIRAIKNRYGPTDEIGCFELTDRGINPIADPSGLFVSPSAGDVPGTCLTIAQEGRRPLALEVQALVDTSSLTQPRRATSGVDPARLAMILAVLQRRVGLELGRHDAYVSTVAGARIAEPAADLAIALALASARAGRPCRQGLVAFGEVGLAGDIRPVTATTRRLTEAARLGFRAAIVPMGSLEPGRIPAGLAIHEVADLADAVAEALAASERRAEPALVPPHLDSRLR